MRIIKGGDSLLDAQITRVFAEMETYGPEAPEYKPLVKNLERLMKLKAEQRQQKISPDTILLVVGNLFGILIIVGYERSHVILSKGLSFIRPRT